MTARHKPEPLGGRELPSSNPNPLRLAADAAVPNAAAVRLLRDMLGRAERGEICFVAVVGQQPDGAIVDGWSAAERCRMYSVCGAFTHLARQFSEFIE